MYVFPTLVLILALCTTVVASPIENVPYNVVGQVLPTQSSVLNNSFNLPEHCKLSRDIGYGSNPHLNWYFDTQTNECEELYYNGEGGNLNRFDTERDCLLNCTPDPCRKVIVNGNEIGALLVDGKHKQCSYNSMSKQDNCPKNYYCSLYAEVCCPEETHDVCSLPKIEGSKYSHYEPRQFFYFNQESGHCEPFYFNGIEGNANRFLKRSECESACVKQFCGEKHPYSKLHGPIICEIDGENNVCPNDFECILTTQQNLSLCCPLKKLPRENLGSALAGSTSTANNIKASTFSIIFVVFFILYV